MGYLIVFFGAGIGGVLRHGVNRAALNLLRIDFPAGTLLVNVIGSFCMGLLAGWFAYRSIHSSQHLQIFLTTGILGGFTTFSAFSLDAVLLWERGQTIGACLYVTASVAISIIGLLTGLTIMKAPI
jgi:CrcB protein